MVFLARPWLASEGAHFRLCLFIRDASASPSCLVSESFSNCATDRSCESPNGTTIPFVLVSYAARVPILGNFHSVIVGLTVQTKDQTAL